jgi:hypothetical protein
LEGLFTMGGQNHVSPRHVGLDRGRFSHGSMGWVVTWASSGRAEHTAIKPAMTPTVAPVWNYAATCNDPNEQSVISVVNQQLLLDYP